MMPVSGEMSAAMQASSGSSARAALPPISSSPSTPFFCALRKQRLDARAFGFVGRDNQLAAFAVMHAAAFRRIRTACRLPRTQCFARSEPDG